MGVAHESPLGVCQKEREASQSMRNKMLWAEEIKIELFCPNATGHIWSKSATTPSVKHGGGSIMLWGGFSVGMYFPGTATLVSIEGKMDGQILD